MRSNRASKTGIQLKMFRKQLTKQFRGLYESHRLKSVRLINGLKSTALIKKWRMMEVTSHDYFVPNSDSGKMLGDGLPNFDN